MSKNDVTLEQARVVIDRVAQAKGLLVNETSGFVKVQSPTSKHRIYVQRSKTLNRIDTTLPIPADDPAHKALAAPNGSISCHVQPDLDQLERALEMLCDPAFGTQVPNKPRPFAATKAPPARKPKPTEEPVEEVRLVAIPAGGSLEERLARIKERARSARVDRIMQNPEKYGAMAQEEAEALVDSKVSLEDFALGRKQELQAETADIVAEAGLTDIIGEGMMTS
jgi:hypothetical protein